MKKVAKLVTVQLTVRVIVNEDAHDQEICNEAMEGLQAKIYNNEIMENLTKDGIINDTESPYVEGER